MRHASALAAVLAAALPATAQPGDGTDGRQLFRNGTTPPCSACHALKDAGAAGNIGPNLDELQPDEARVAQAVREGFENMPAFGGALSEAEIRAVAEYVARAAGRQ